MWIATNSPSLVRNFLKEQTKSCAERRDYNTYNRKNCRRSVRGRWIRGKGRGGRWKIGWIGLPGTIVDACGHGRLVKEVDGWYGGSSCCLRIWFGGVCSFFNQCSWLGPCGVCLYQIELFFDQCCCCGSETGKWVQGAALGENDLVLGPKRWS